VAEVVQAANDKQQLAGESLEDQRLG
jgi:hypothetical protein